MDKLKERMYDYEVTPPEEVWNAITTELDKGSKIIPITKEKNTNNKLYYFLAAAACVAVLIFSAVWFMSSRKNVTKEYSSIPVNTKQDPVIKETNEVSEKITAPKKIETNTVRKDNTALVKNVAPKKQPLKSQNTIPVSDVDVALIETPNTYITIAGPEGQPVKVSSKMASLIESSDNSYPPKPVWNKKINKWKDIMKANTLTPTTGNFLDIVDLTNSLKEK